MIAYPRVETRTCERCQIRQPTDPRSPICSQCLTELMHAMLVRDLTPKPQPKPKLSPWKMLKDYTAILWYSYVPRRHCVHCGLRNQDCIC